MLMQHLKLSNCCSSFLASLLKLLAAFGGLLLLRYHRELFPPLRVAVVEVWSRRPIHEEA
jgi:hypothetical protein